ncbi:hypothetical protein CH275_16450 [Rhodococcus sp. 06-235-1A]|uniref:HAD-IIIA family hydrolase n=1 Tax=Rhodococcus sp. 06-235-1A TaxID=2022508 RepID=UPI000B9BAD28|nr:hypothetical protein CH275_16450 [Rhodococcus sp. 06-235-1A]
MIGAVLFDRDGVLVRSRVVNGRPVPASDPVAALDPQAPRLVARLRSLGWAVAVVTNQPDVARGLTTAEYVTECHRTLARKLALDPAAFFVCFHDNADRCSCRKPLPALLTEAASWCDVPITNTVMIGDRWRDIAAAQAAGADSVWIDRGYDEPVPEPPFRCRVSSLSEAVGAVLAG